MRCSTTPTRKVKKIISIILKRKEVKDMAFIKGFIMSFILVTIGRKFNDK